MRTLNLIIKRMIDFFGSLIGMIMISPIFITIGMLIKLTSKGPVFFTQERLGKNGKVFTIFKFRTMVVNAEHMGAGLFVTEKDHRITKVGKILRATSLDELPQLLNVFIGDMSLVGPRPPVPQYPYKYEDYNDYQKIRFDMKPGMTGLSQVTVRNSVSWEERIMIDVTYVKRFTIWLDIKLLCRTVQKIVKGEHIYIEAESKKNGKAQEVKP